MVRYRAHCLMEEVQSFHKSHLTPPSGNYLISIAPTVTRVTENIMMMQYMSTLLTISMAVAVRRYYTARIARRGRSMAFIKATKHRHRASSCSDIIKRDIAMPWICYLLRVSGVGDGAIYASICAHAYLQMDQSQKKHTKKIGRKHSTPSEKEKKRNTKSVPTSIRFSPLRSKKSQP